MKLLGIKYSPKNIVLFQGLDKLDLQLIILIPSCDLYLICYKLDALNSLLQIFLIKKEAANFYHSLVLELFDFLFYIKPLK